MKSFLITAFILLSGFLFSQTEKTQLPLIPQPNYVAIAQGSFTLSDSTVIVAGEDQFEANYLKSYLKENYGLELRIDSHYPPFKNFISLLTLISNDGGNSNKEFYDLKITTKGIAIKANANEGFFYALQTLFQLMPLDTSVRRTVPCLQIYDSPRYLWRGMHLDCSRHFFSKDEVKKYIDYIAMYKMNTFHWHLTDDQGWRIEIKKYPLLTQISSQRKETVIGKPVDKKGQPLKDVKYDNKPYGGFYTQDEIKEVVAYASERHITVVPEIEMPGHSLAALAAYPQLSCIGGPFEPRTTWGVSDELFCAGNDSSFYFLQDIISEVIDLFPGKYIHIGGDECPKVRWQKCPKCQNRIKEEHLKDEHQLQSYFITRMEKFINDKGRQIIGWDEILEGGLAPNATVMSWRGIKGGIEAAKQNHTVVMSPGKPCYFDHYQVKDRTNEPLAIGGFNPIDSVYNYDPTPVTLSEDQKKYILGAQGNVWTEYILDFKQVEYMAIPRMPALAEALWTKPENKNYRNFIERLKTHSRVLDKKHTNYAKHFKLNTTSK
ncbi:MAG: beta-N-acetylglucosaminidase [Bacteroidota bacterium]|jgi:hexosaminidase|nr:beta-N-acetylglucosaminidase [Bacteroidota bacterium]